MTLHKKIIALALTVAMLFATGCTASSGGAGKVESYTTAAATSVNICEILDELGVENVVGVPETSGQLPVRYENVATIGSPMNPDLEIVKSIGPEVVLVPQALEDSLAEKFSSAGINAEFLDFSSVEGMYAEITKMGKMFGRESEAERLNAEYETYMESYEAAATDNPSVLILMTFPDGFYLIATEDSYAGNLAALAGCENVYEAGYEGNTSGFINVNPEDIVQKEPDYIMVFAHYSEEEAFSYMEEEFETDSTWTHFEAVEKGNIIYLPTEHFGMTADLQWTDALDYLQPLLYGEDK